MQLCKLFKCYSNHFLISLSILDLEILTKRVSVLYAVVHVPGNIIFLHLFRSENSFSVSVRRGRRPRFEETEKPFELRKRCMNYILICFSSSKERGGRDGGREREYVFSVRRVAERECHLRIIQCPLRARVVPATFTFVISAAAAAVVSKHPFS